MSVRFTATLVDVRRAIGEGHVLHVMRGMGCTGRLRMEKENGDWKKGSDQAIGQCKKEEDLLCG